MREALDHWPYIIAAYAVGLTTLAVLIGWSWAAMKRAEKRREELKRR